MKPEEKHPLKKKRSTTVYRSFLHKRRNLGFELKLKPILFEEKNVLNAEEDIRPIPPKLCPTADIEKYLNRTSINMSSYVNAQGRRFFKLNDTGLILKEGSLTLRNGAQGIVSRLTAYTPQQSRAYELVRKIGKDEVKREIAILQAIREESISSKSIQKILYRQRDRTDISYLSRYEKGGDLKLHQAYIQEQYQHNNENVFSYLFSIMIQLVEGLELLHESQFKDQEQKSHWGIVHNDLKPANILVKQNGHIVIADFGCAYFADEVAPQYGTIFFTDPNLFLDTQEFAKKPLKNATKSDIWSLGLLFEDLIHGTLPAKVYNKHGYSINEKQSINMECEFKLKKWATLYNESDRCKKAKEANDYLKKQERNNEVDTATQKKIIESSKFVMQLPVEERPTSKELKKYLYEFAICFGTIEKREEKFNIFASELMKNKEKIEINFNKASFSSEKISEPVSPRFNR